MAADGPRGRPRRPVRSRPRPAATADPDRHRGAAGPVRAALLELARVPAPRAGHRSALSHRDAELARDRGDVSGVLCLRAAARAFRVAGRRRRCHRRILGALRAAGDGARGADLAPASHLAQRRRPRRLRRRAGDRRADEPVLGGLVRGGRAARLAWRAAAEPDTDLRRAAVDDLPRDLARAAPPHGVAATELYNLHTRA